MTGSQNHPVDKHSLDGERGITSIAESKGEKNNTEVGKKIGIAGGIAFLGFLAFLQWPAGEENVPEEAIESTRRIRSGSQFQPADILEPKPEIPPTAEQPVSEAPIGPIEKMRKEQVELQSGPSEAELLFESSKRAPLLAFKGNARPSSHSGINSPEGGAIFGSTGTGQGQNQSGLAAQLQPTKLEGSLAAVLANPHLTITQGTIIPCSLDTAMDSTQPGMVRCTVNDDVYSTTGAVVLLEKGTRIVGQYRGGLQRGTKRLFVVWTRAETPNGVVVTLDSPGADGVGRAGFDGDIDTQFWTRFGGTIMLSIIDDALASISANQSNAENIENTANGISSLAQTELKSTINVPIVLRKNQGEQVAVMVSRDLDFSSVYRLKIR